MEPRQRAALAKSIITTHYPDLSAAPKGLLITIFKALGEAELRGFDDCLSYFQQREAENDNRAAVSPA